MSRMVTAPGRSREYETIYILRPDIDADGADKVGQRVNEVVGRESGTMTKVELWGRRRLAYDIKKKSEGIYVVVTMSAEPATAQELDRQLNLSESVMRTKLLRPGA